MLTRVISGAALILVVGGILAAGYFYPPVLVTFVAIICAMGCYEILNNTGIIKKKTVTVGACIFGLICVFANCGYINIAGYSVNGDVVSILFALFVVICSLVFNSSMNIGAIGSAVAFPIMISYAFSSLVLLYAGKSGVFFLLLLLNFSSVCDTGAYFTGVLLGKHKLCPEISPKKTIEGAVGGIFFSLICTVILCFAFHKTADLVILLILTVVFCIVGMCGDLFASVIKRSVGIKDYGKLIPGHGGILDRFDSILLIATVMYLFISGGVV